MVNKAQMRRFLRKIAEGIVAGIALIIIFFFLLVGVPIGWGDRILPLHDYQTIENHKVAVKFKSVDLFFLPLVTWRKEYVMNRPSTDDSIRYVSLDESLSTKLQQQYGSFSEHHPWKFSWGWTIGCVVILLFIASQVFIIHESLQPGIASDGKSNSSNG